MYTMNRWMLKTDSNGVDPTGFGNMDAPNMLRKCSTLMDRASQGACAASLDLAMAPVAAQATLTFSGNGTAAATITVCGIVITYEASGAAGASNQINVGSTGDGTDVAAYVAALINGTTSTAGFTTKSTSWLGICTASVSGAVVTLTAYLPGIMGNGLALAKTEATVALTHLWGASVAGTEGTQKTFSLGL
jgi:phage tail sheath gpL-like